MISEKWKNVAFIIPAVAYIVILSFYPSGYAVYGSFQTRLSTFTTVNYKEIAQLHLVASIYNTVIVTLTALGFQFLLGFAIATILTKEFFGKKAFSVLFLIPFGVATVVSGFVFSYIFTTNAGGYANTILVSLGFNQVNWVTSFWNGVLSLVIADSWKNTPIVALILLAGMNSISPDVYHQAVIDGAGPASRFFRITLPNLGGYIAIALIIRGVSEFNIFAMALLLFHFQLLTTITYSLYDGGGTVYEAYAAATILLAFILVFTGIILYNRNREFRIQNGLYRKKNWYEKFRWFYTSDGYLAVVENAPGSAEKILKHFSNDYVKVSSSKLPVPSAYIDYEGLAMPPKSSVVETAQFVLSYSSYWRTREGNPGILWMDNVSKTKKPIEVYAADMELAISQVSGEALPMIVPKGTKRVVSGLVATIQPGDDNIENVAMNISKEIGVKKKDILRLLPPGTLHIEGIERPNTSKILTGGSTVEV